MDSVGHHLPVDLFAVFPNVLDLVGRGGFLGGCRGCTGLRFLLVFHFSSMTGESGLCLLPELVGEVAPCQDGLIMAIFSRVGSIGDDLGADQPLGILGSMNAGQFQEGEARICLAVKDIQDKKGDDTAGLRTTASLSPNQLTIALLVPATLYVFLMFLPYTLGHFHGIYLVLCAAAVLPLHILWLYWFFKKDSSKTAGRISAVMKVEMLCGLAALALDKYFF